MTQEQVVREILSEFGMTDEKKISDWLDRAEKRCGRVYGRQRYQEIPDNELEDYRTKVRLGLLCIFVAPELSPDWKAIAEETLQKLNDSN